MAQSTQPRPHRAGWLRRFLNLSRFCLSLLPGWRGRLALALLLALIQLGGLMVTPLLGARIIDALRAGQVETFRTSLLLLAAACATQIGLGYLQGVFFMRLEEDAAHRLRSRVVEGILIRPVAFFERHWLGDLVSRALGDTAGLKGFLTGILLQAVVDGLTLLVVLAILVALHPALALLTAAAAPLTIIYLRRMAPRLEAQALSLREQTALLSGHLHGWLSRPLALKAAALEPVAADRFAGASQVLARRAVGLGRLGARVDAVNGALVQLPSLLIFGFGGLQVLGGSLSLGSLFAFMTLAGYFAAPTQRLIGLQGALPGLLPLHRRVRPLMGPDPRAARSQAAGQVSPASATGPRWPVLRLVATQVESRRCGEDGATHTLEVPSLIAPRGELTGITGANGSGKSTLARLLSGLDRPRCGAVILETRAGQRLRPGAAPAAMGFLPQEPALFHGTLEENVTLFHRRPRRQQRDRAARLAGVAAWLGDLPAGWRTPLNAGTLARLSGGQIQAIALARLLYQDPAVVILDEPGSHLDAGGREALLALLDVWRRRRIIVVITHDPGLLARCQRLYRLTASSHHGGRFQCRGEAVRPDLPSPPSLEETHA